MAEVLWIVVVSVLAMASRASALSGFVEIERKYVAPADLAERIAARSGSFVGAAIFTDRYLDVPDTWPLATKDCWLRQRGSSYELKIPLRPREGRRRSGGETEEFRELMKYRDIASELAPLLGQPLPGYVPATGDVEAFESLLEGTWGLRPFAKFTTTRSKYELGRVVVDTDVASFGHAVLELEVKCPRGTPEEVAAAREEIDATAALLDLEPLPVGTGGKLETYLRMHCEDMLGPLLEAGVLP